jgi:GNAT superfamily N-acetyltransferase
MNPAPETRKETPSMDFTGLRTASFMIRPARPEDAETLANLVRELAIYEKLEPHAKATAEDFRRHLFGPRPAAEAALAEVDDEPVGFALWFSNYSTFRGQPGLYLEDIFVKPEYRGRGIGKALLASLAQLAVGRGCGRMDWSVLDWNAPSIAFYRALGARPLDEWTVYRLDDEPLRRLAGLAEDAD